MYASCEGIIAFLSMQTRAAFIGMDLRRLRAVCSFGSCPKAVTGQRECHRWLTWRGHSGSDCERQFKRTLQSLSLPELQVRERPLKMNAK